MEFSVTCLLKDKGGLACALSLMQELISDGETELLSSPPSYYDPDQKEKQVRQCVLLLLHKPVPPEINKETKI